MNEPIDRVLIDNTNIEGDHSHLLDVTYNKIKSYWKIYFLS